MDLLWIVLLLGVVIGAALFLSAAAGTKSSSERMLESYAALLEESRRTGHHLAHQPKDASEPLIAQPAQVTALASDESTSPHA